jgi:hypothetical protein
MDKELYEEAAFKRDFQYLDLQKAFDTVVEFLKKKKRILVGGMAIDYSLRTKGSKLYSDNKLPDYDFLSPEFHKDAYEIGSILAKMNISGVSIVRALHISTMKVRVNFVVIADITYVPKNIYDKIPTKMYEDITIVHPYWQMIDQHLALSLPLSGPPLEAIYSRLEKDMKRFDLLHKYWDINSKVRSNFKLNLIPKKVKLSDCNDCCIAECAALAFWIKFAMKLGYKSKHVELPVVEIENEYLVISCPNDKLPSFMSFEFDKKIKNMKGILMNPILDKINARFITDDFIYINSENSLFAASIMEIDHQKFHVCNLQSVLTHTLTAYFVEDDKDALYAYLIALDIVLWAVKNYTKDQISKLSDNSIELLVSQDTAESIGESNYVDKSNYEHLEKLSQLLPVVTTYGNSNISESALMTKYDIISLIYQTKKDNILTPKNFYFKNIEGKINNEVPQDILKFDPEDSPIYQINGKKSKSVENRESSVKTILEDLLNSIDELNKPFAKENKSGGGKQSITNKHSNSCKDHNCIKHSLPVHEFKYTNIKGRVHKPCISNQCIRGLIFDI